MQRLLDPHLTSTQPSPCPSKKRLGPREMHELLLEKGLGLSLSQKERARFCALHDKILRDAFDGFKHLKVVGKWDGPPVWARRKNISTPNYFFWDYIAHSAGLDAPWFDTVRDAVRFGGASWDGVYGLKQFDRVYPAVPQPSDAYLGRFMRFLGLEGREARLIPPEEILLESVVKTKANPGPQFLVRGIVEKGRAVKAAVAMLHCVLRGYVSPSDLPPVMYGLGGRGKPTSFSKVLEKAQAQKPAGRAVWMADAWETVFSWRYVVGINELLSLPDCPIYVGYNNKDPIQRRPLLDLVQSGNLYLKIDFEAFDSSVPGDLIRLAFRVIRRLFPALGQADEGILHYLCENMIKCRIVLPNRDIVEKDGGGVPSGAGFTSIVDSIVACYIAYSFRDYFVKRLRRPGELFLGIANLGDDLRLILKIPSQLPGDRIRRGKELNQAFAAFCSRKFGMIVNTAKSGVDLYPFVRIAVPKIYRDVPDSSRRYLRENPPVRVLKNGRIVVDRGFAAYDVLDDSESVYRRVARYSKRFNYVFAGAFSFCSTYYLRDGSPIRPKPEMMERLATTSAPVNTVYEWRALILQYLIEFWNNLPARAELLSMYCDSFYQELDGVYSLADARRSALATLANPAPAVAFVAERGYAKVDRQDGDFRCWWCTQKNWWPDLSDPRFNWFRPSLVALSRLQEALEDPALDAQDLYGRLRIVLLKPADVHGYYVPARSRESLYRVLDIFRTALGPGAGGGGLASSAAYDPRLTASDVALAVRVLFADRPPPGLYLMGFLPIADHRIIVHGVNTLVCWPEGFGWYPMTVLPYF